MKGNGTMTTEERLTRLERKNRWLTLALLFMGVAATLVVTAGMQRTEAVPEVVKARRFLLVDENGKERARLGLAKAFSGLVLSSENGSAVALAAGNDMQALTFMGENGKQRAVLMTLKDGHAGLAVLDENEKPRARLVVDKDGPGLNLLDENDKIRAALQLPKDGPSLNLSDENGKQRAVLGANKDGPILDLFDENGGVLKKLP
jgi:hypothetical protein